MHEARAKPEPEEVDEEIAGQEERPKEHAQKCVDVKTGSAVSTSCRTSNMAGVCQRLCGALESSTKTCFGTSTSARPVHLAATD